MLEELKDANSYIIGKIEEKDSLILEMENFAHENNVPIVTKEVAEYLKFIVKTHKVKKHFRSRNSNRIFRNFNGKRDSRARWKIIYY